MSKRKLTATVSPQSGEFAEIQRELERVYALVLAAREMVVDDAEQAPYVLLGIAMDTVFELEERIARLNGEFVIMGHVPLSENGSAARSRRRSKSSNGGEPTRSAK